MGTPVRPQSLARRLASLRLGRNSERAEEQSVQNRFGGLVLSAGKELVKQTWVRNNDKTKARAEERREKNIGWIGRLFTAKKERKKTDNPNEG